MRYSWTFGVACLGLLLGATAARADQMDNPLFQAWTKFAVDSSETLTGEVSNSQMKMDMEMTRKLVKKDDDSVTLEISMTMTVMGQQHTAPPRQQVINAKVDKVDVVQKANEKVDAAGKTFDCKVYEVPDTNPNNTDHSAKATIWANGDVPGGLVKMVAGSQRGTVTYLLKSFEVK